MGPAIQHLDRPRTPKLVKMRKKRTQNKNKGTFPVYINRRNRLGHALVSSFLVLLIALGVFFPSMECVPDTRILQVIALADLVAALQMEWEYKKPSFRRKVRVHNKPTINSGPRTPTSRYEVDVVDFLGVVRLAEVRNAFSSTRCISCQHFGSEKYQTILDYHRSAANENKIFNHIGFFSFLVLLKDLERKTVRVAWCLHHNYKQLMFVPAKNQLERPPPPKEGFSWTNRFPPRKNFSVDFYKDNGVTFTAVVMKAKIKGPTEHNAIMTQAIPSNGYITDAFGFIPLSQILHDAKTVPIKRVEEVEKLMTEIRERMSEPPTSRSFGPAKLVLETGGTGQYAQGIVDFARN